MTNTEFTKRRKRLWPTQREAAVVLGLSHGAVSHYESGRSPVPLVVVKLLTLIEATRKGSSGK